VLIQQRRGGGRYGVFSLSKKNFKPSYQMFGHIHRALNIDEKITNYTDCDKVAI
jgi:hypothetical protein